MWPPHLKKKKKIHYNPNKLSKWKILVFPPLLHESAANFSLYPKSINSLHKRFLVQHRIPFDVKNTESSKVSLPLNIMTRQNPRTGNPILNLPTRGTAIPKGERPAIVSPAGVFVLRLRFIQKGDNVHLITKEKHSSPYKELKPSLLTLSFPLITFSTFWKVQSLVKLNSPGFSPHYLSCTSHLSKLFFFFKKGKSMSRTGCRGLGSGYNKIYRENKKRLQEKRKSRNG